MQLTRLDIKGFKSFGDKISIHFDAGITAIVGPNGCGKSNVVDAIRWVLGEQSTRVLRSEKMENIIFNGTKTRKAAQLAEVSLSFNNDKQVISSEFSQVTITRKLYRSGDSEYRLNDVPCRLKDITDLFLDTGIGSDSYSIIELKMVEEIIANKEHSRRKLFEEASGISKYKIRKKQTLSRLRDTEQDLSRVEDLLFEIEKNLKTLAHQARKAQRYYKLREEYKLVSVSLAYQKLERFQQELSSLQEKEALQKAERGSLDTQMHAAEVRLQKEKAETMLAEKNLSLQQKALNQELARIRNFESEQKIKNAQLTHLQNRQQETEKNLQQDTRQIDHVTYSIKRIREDLYVQREKAEQAGLALEEQRVILEEKRRQQAAGSAEVDALNRQRQHLSSEQNTIEKQVAVLGIQIDSLREQQEKTQQDRSSKAQDLSGFRDSIEALEASLETLENQQAVLRGQQDALDEQLEQTSKRLEAREADFHKVARSLDARDNEYQLTKSLVDNLEGFPESIRYLKKHTRALKNAPLFSDVLYCQQAYRIAIENFLEPYMNHYVVENWTDAMQAIDLLQEAARGRAGFFVLQGVDTPQQQPEVPQGLTPALSVVEVEEKYAGLCARLLHNVYFAAQWQAFPEDFQGTILDPDGKLIKAPMRLSGGSTGLFEGKRIGRARNLVHLGKEIKSLKQAHATLQEQILQDKAALEEIRQASVKQELEEVSAQISRYQQQRIALVTKYEQYRDFLSQADLQEADFEKKISELQQELQAGQPELDKKREALNALMNVLETRQEALREASRDLQDQSEKFNQLQSAWHQQENLKSGLEKDLEYKEIQLGSLEDRVEKMETELGNIRREIQETLSKVDGSDGALSEMYQEKERLEKGFQDIEKRYFTLRGSVNDTEESISRIRRMKEQCDVLISEIKDTRHAISIEFSALKERLAAEFSIDVQQIEEMELLEADEPELRSRADKLKGQLDQYGSVNPMAMEAYEEMDERYQFILREKQDLLDAKADLLITMKEIDDTAEEKFLHAFNRVRENFQQVFRSLFNAEDTCDLIITDPEHILESDIEIIARPKGKRPLSINQLSGGEKTLTATAILFALYLLKPAPFCIFDEVDAPLDDTNIDKFNNIIREFSQDSQFIIVSHNKRTIASTDIIYGVTMVEPGVSRVVAVDLREAYAKAEAQ